MNKIKFPVLVKQLFETDAIKNKTNLVKSFLKAGIFPFNPNAIDRSHILQNNEFIKSSNSDVASTSSSNFSVVDLVISLDSDMIDEESKFTENNLQIISIMCKSIDDCSSFTCPRDVVSTLDRVLKEIEILSENEDCTDGDDEDSLPIVQSTSFLN